MEELEKVIELIHQHHDIEFVVEKVTFNGGDISYRLKRRKYFRMFPLFKKKVFDEYEENSIGTVMRFPDIGNIIYYLKMQFAHAEGFVTEFEDIIGKNEK